MAIPKDVRFQKRDRTAYLKFNFDSDMLNLYLAIDENKSLKEIAREVALPPEIFKYNFLKLAQMGLIIQVKATEAYVDEAFIQNMRDVIIGLIGPLGDMLMNDTARDMDLDIQRIPVSALPHFITILARELPGTRQSNAFRQAMSSALGAKNM